MSFLFIAISAIALALLNRCRGGLVPMKSGQLSRLLFWGLPVGLAVLVGYGIVPFLYAVPLAFAGVAIPAWGDYVHLQTKKDWLMLALCGLCVTALPAIGIAVDNFKDGLIFGLSGVFMAPFYYLGNLVPSKIKNFEQGVPMSELFFGAWIGLVLSLLVGL